MLDARELCKRVVKYVLEGLMVAFAALVLPKQKPDLEAAFALALVAAATFAVLDLFAPNSSVVALLDKVLDSVLVLTLLVSQECKFIK